RVGDVVLGECAADVHHVDLVILDQQDVERLAVHPRTPSRKFLGQVKWNAAPWPGADSSLTRPPRLSTIFFTIDRPIPVPSTLSRAARVWKMSQIRSWNSGAIPGPSSRTVNSTIRPASRHSTSMMALSRPAAPYLRALPS